ncbi:uncharacterized protein LOC142420039 [Mycteria americana]|uniref:uncharacterized protein LOC142420039 n=1 Tax=Mycteria americana TaxID=33587 RepID=UPI003F585509
MAMEVPGVKFTALAMLPGTLVPHQPMGLGPWVVDQAKPRGLLPAARPCPPRPPATAPPPGSALGAGPPCAPHPTRQHPEAVGDLPELAGDNLQVQDQQSFTTDITNIHNMLTWLNTADSKDTIPNVPDVPNVPDSTIFFNQLPEFSEYGAEVYCPEDQVAAAMLGDADPSWGGWQRPPCWTARSSRAGWRWCSPPGCQRVPWSLLRRVLRRLQRGVLQRVPQIVQRRLQWRPLWRVPQRVP